MATFNTIKLVSTASDAFICYGTSTGKIGFCDFEGDRIKGLKEFKAFKTEIADIKINRTGDKILAIGSDKDSDGIGFHRKVKLFKLDGTLITEYQYNYIGQPQDVYLVPQRCLFNVNETLIYTACYGGQVAVFNIDGSLHKVFQANEKEDGAAGNVWGFDLSPDGNFLLTTGQKKAKMWTSDGTLIKVLQVNKFDPINSIFSPDGKLIAVDEFVRNVNIYKNDGVIKTKIEAYEHGGINHIVFSNDSQYILIFNQMNTTKLFDINANVCIEYMLDPDTVRGFFAPNSKTIFTMSFKSIQKINIIDESIKTIRGIK